MRLEIINIGTSSSLAWWRFLAFANVPKFQLIWDDDQAMVPVSCIIGVVACEILHVIHVDLKMQYQTLGFGAVVKSS